MDKVKKYWQKVVKDRDEFWSSFFKKYEEDKQDVDVRSYIDKSSSRIESLLELAADEAEDEKGGEASDPKVPSRYFEEQVSDSSEADFIANSTPFSLLNNETNLDILKEEYEPNSSYKSPIAQKPESPSKKPEPTFIVEIVPEEDEVDPKPRITHSAKKLKLFESKSPAKNTVDETVVEDQSNTLSETFLSESNTSFHSFCNNDSFRFVCRRVKSRNSHASAPKRFKLM